MISSISHAKIQSAHLRRQAVVYVRQSSSHQVRGCRESGQRQYALVERAHSLGWPTKSVQTIDDDQGRSGAGAAHREGFKRLLAEIGAGQVGVVLALEASRLARSSADWHRLVEICVVTQTLLADETAVYDPRDPNDRLLLGVKGTISEAELFTLRCRLHEGRWNKARRGELARSLPVGYLVTEKGHVTKDPDRQVHSRLDHVFRLFAKHRVAHRVLVELLRRKLKIPVKTWGGPRHGEITWKEPEIGQVMRLLHNPTYAGAYVYGEKKYDAFNRYPSNGKARVHPRPLEEWSVVLHNVYPAYISWQEFVQNQETLRKNWYRDGTRGAPRQGRALLQGIAYCGRCGARLRVWHQSTKANRSPTYGCVDGYQRRGEPTCQCFASPAVDEAVTQLFLAAVTPAKLEIALRAQKELDAERDEITRQWALQLERAGYEVELARRRYELTDPANRLVAAELEAQWEESLRRREQLERQREEAERCEPMVLNGTDRERIRELSSDLELVWRSKTTSMQDRKTLLRFLVKRVHLDGVTESGQIRIDVEWHTGAHTTTKIGRPRIGEWSPRTPQAAVVRIRGLLGDHEYAAIASKLNAEGFRTAKGLPFDDKSVGYVVRTRGWGARKGSAGKPGNR